MEGCSCGQRKMEGLATGMDGATGFALELSHAIGH